MEDRFLGHVDKTRKCWFWVGSKHYKGYGQFNVDGNIKKAHRVSYELFVGKIPEGMFIDHLCRNPSCVNPEHLDIVTNRENVVRGNTFLKKKSPLPLGVNQVGNRFRAQKKIRGRKTAHLGYFSTPELAHKAYREAV